MSEMPGAQMIPLPLSYCPVAGWTSSALDDRSGFSPTLCLAVLEGPVDSPPLCPVLRPSFHCCLLLWGGELFQRLWSLRQAEASGPVQRAQNKGELGLVSRLELALGGPFQAELMAAPGHTSFLCSLLLSGKLEQESQTGNRPAWAWVTGWDHPTPTSTPVPSLGTSLALQGPLVCLSLVNSRGIS